MRSLQRFLWIAGLFLASFSAQAVDFFMSPDGVDTNAGTREAPFQSLERARDAVRASADAERTVVLLPGRYHRTETFELGDQDVGTTNHPIIYKADQAGTVFVDGGITVPYSAVESVTNSAIRARLIEDVRDRIMQVDLNALGITNFGTFGPRGFRRAYIPAPMELFIGSEAQTIARWPNAGEGHVALGDVVDSGSVPRNGDYSLRPGTFKYVTSRAEGWTQAQDLYISGIFHYGFADDTIKVANINTTNGTFTTDLPHLYGFNKNSLSKWYALNLIEEIDLPGEYCIDRPSGLLLFLPPDDFDEHSLIQLSMLEDVMIAMEDSIHVRFENLVFENTRGTAVYIEGGQGNEMVGCTFRNLGLLAVQMGQGVEPFPYGQHDACGNKADGEPGVPASRIIGSWHEHIYRFTAWDRNAGTDHRILSCDIYNTGAGGILLGGGDRVTLTPASNTVENCHFYNVNRLERTYKAPVNIDGVGNRILHNRIHDCEGMAIYLHGNDHLVEYNHIYDVLKDISDQGAIYMGRDPSECGSMFRYNFFHDFYDRQASYHGVQSIFFDDRSTYGASVIGNVFLRAGSTEVVKYNGGGEAPILNNIMIDCPDGKGLYNISTANLISFMNSDLGTQRLFNAVNITNPPYSTKYPVVADIYNGLREVQFPYERNYEVVGDYSQFVDPENGDFSLRADSTVYTTIDGFEEIPFDEIGLYVDAWRTKLPVGGSASLSRGWTYVDCIDDAEHPQKADWNTYLSPATNGTPFTAATEDGTAAWRYRNNGPADVAWGTSCYQGRNSDEDGALYTHIDTGAAGTYSIKLYGIWASHSDWSLQYSLDGGTNWSASITKESITAVNGIDGQGWGSNSTELGTPGVLSAETRGNLIIGEVATTDGHIFIGVRHGSGDRAEYDGLAYRLEPVGHIDGYSLSGTNMSLTVSNSLSGCTYEILAADSLVSPQWSNILVESGTGSNLLFELPVDATNRYFKLEVRRP